MKRGIAILMIKYIDNDEDCYSMLKDSFGPEEIQKIIDERNARFLKNKKKK